MATCKDRILKNLMAGKQMSIEDMVRALKHGKSTVKSAVLTLKKDGYIKIVAYRRGYNSTTPMHVYAWSGKQIDSNTPSPTINKRNKRILDTLERRECFSVLELAVEAGYSEDVIRKALKGLREEGKVRIVEWRPQHGARIALFGLSDGQPDAEFVKDRLEIERQIEARRTVVKARRDPAAAWF